MTGHDKLMNYFVASACLVIQNIVCRKDMV